MSKVVVAGSINMDVVASVQRHPLPGETIAGANLRYFAGGKGANQAVAAAFARAPVRLVGAVGQDAFGDDLIGFLDGSGVDVQAVSRVPDAPTGTALIVVDAEGENTIVVVPGANDTVDEGSVVTTAVDAGDVCVAQYEIPQSAVVAFFRHGQDAGATCVLNPAPAAATPHGLLSMVDVLVLNETELGVLAGMPITAASPDDEIVAAIGQLRDAGLAGAAIATLGARGALAVVSDRVLRVQGHDVDAVDTTGAGDCFVGSLAAELARGSTIDAALNYANAAAAVCVTRPGAGPSMPERPEVEVLLTRDDHARRSGL